MKKWIAIGVVSLLLTTGATAWAAYDAIKIIINGKTVQSEVAPFIKDGKTMVPLRVVSEYLGAEVNWDAKTQSVTVINNGKTITNAEYEELRKIQFKNSIFVAMHSEYDALASAHNNLLACVQALILKNTTEGNSRFSNANKRLVKAEEYENGVYNMISNLPPDQQWLLKSKNDSLSSTRKALNEISNDLAGNWNVESISSQLKNAASDLDSMSHTMKEGLIDSTDSVTLYMNKIYENN